ncbi:MAG: rho, partial [Modestobacter sp.]|nr:rho [Modestobacter sp.]
MSETTDLIDGAAAAPSDEAAASAGTAARSRRRGSGLSGMLLPELQRLAGELGIPGTGKMRKSDLVAAISERQVGGSNGSAAAPAATTPAATTPAATTPAATTPAATTPAATTPTATTPTVPA